MRVVAKQHHQRVRVQGAAALRLDWAHGTRHIAEAPAKHGGCVRVLVQARLESLRVFAAQDGIHAQHDTEKELHHRVEELRLCDAILREGLEHLQRSGHGRRLGGPVQVPCLPTTLAARARPTVQRHKERAPRVGEVGRHENVGMAIVQ